MSNKNPSQTALIVDDEALARARIVRFLKKIEPSYKIEEAKDGLEAIEKISKLKPQLLFLDIQMPGLTGFEILQQIEPRILENLQIVFQTAYDAFAVKAFDENACDYLLKPFTEERFIQALEKANRRTQPIKPIIRLENNLIETKHYLNQLSIRQNGKLKIVETATIDYFLSQDHYTFIYVGKFEMISEVSLNRLEANLDPRLFIRLHRNSIASISQIADIGTDTVTLKNGVKLDLSRNRRKDLLNFFKK